MYWYWLHWLLNKAYLIHEIGMHLNAQKTSKKGIKYFRFPLVFYQNKTEFISECYETCKLLKNVLTNTLAPLFNRIDCLALAFLYIFIAFAPYQLNYGAWLFCFSQIEHFVRQFCYHLSSDRRRVIFLTITKNVLYLYAMKLTWYELENTLFIISYCL